MAKGKYTNKYLAELIIYLDNFISNNNLNKIEIEEYNINSKRYIQLRVFSNNGYRYVQGESIIDVLNKLKNNELINA